MSMARASSGLAYPERFYAAAAHAGFGGGSPGSPSANGAISKFQSDVALLLYGLYQQATVGPCSGPKPRAWNPVEHSKWTSWHGLGNMASTEAMRLFVKILEEEDPAWYSRVPTFTVEPIVDVEMHKPKVESITEPAITNDNSFEVPKTISTENGSMPETQDKDVIIMEGLGSVGIYDQWIAPSVSGQRPKPRYEHGAALVQDKMYIFGGNHNGRYLSDLQVLDLKRLTWSKVEAKATLESPESTPVTISPCAGHSLISWGNKILSVAGHTKDLTESVTVKEFDPQTCTWSNLKTYGKPPISRGGQSVTLVGDTLVMFGGEDAKRSLLNDLHILDLETMTWDDTDAIGTLPSPRSDHAAACHVERYLLIFGGASHATVFNDVHVLDLQTMEWSRPKHQGVTPGPRAGHAGVTIGETWFIAGGGDNKNGVSETLVLNMSTLVWSIVTSVQGRAPLASEGLSLVSTTYNGEDFLVSFGGYNGRYSNEVYVLKPSHKSDTQSKIERPVSDSIATLHPTATTSRDAGPESEAGQDGKTREIVMDNNDSEPLNVRNEETSERVVTALKAEKEELEATLNKEQLHNRTPSKAQPLLSRGAHLADSPSALARSSDVIFLIVGYPSDVRHVVLDPATGVLAAASPGSFIVDMTTSDPSLALEISTAAAAAGCHSVDAPVSGGDRGARTASLSIFAGGDQSTVQNLTPLFNLMGKVNYMGGPGSGQQAKLGNQIAIASTMVGLVEGMVYAHKAGLDVGKWMEAISTGAAGSKSLELYGKRILERDMAPGFYVRHFVKDLGICLKECERMGLALPGLAQAQQLYVSLVAHGEGGLGTQALVLAVERLNNICLKKGEGSS